MSDPVPDPVLSLSLSHAELVTLRDLSLEVDALLEESLRSRESLQQTFTRCFPDFLRLTGAKAIALTTQNEELLEQTWTLGTFAPADPATLLRDLPFGHLRLGVDSLVTQPLDVAGTPVGTLGLLFDGDVTEAPALVAVNRRLHALAEQLDTVLVTVQTAAEKHHLILSVSQLLANPVFEAGMDGAVQALAERLKLPGFVLVYRDAVRAGVLHYRVYEQGRLAYESGSRKYPALERAISRHGVTLIARDNDQLRQALVGPHHTTEALLIAGSARQPPMGKILVWSDREGFGAYALDLFRVLASTLAQRLVDYNRERIHLSQFFPADLVDELLKDPEYEERYLAPRDEEVGILFADINSFTRLCERGLESPREIGQFVDRWSNGVVDILWKHGGVFDKMVGDCVIGLFGPPFFQSGRLARAEAAVRAALEIQDFTVRFQTPEMMRLCQSIDVPGLGVAVGVNLAHTFCGLFGPNRQYTGFSSGMNQTARLQSLGHFRETLLMESVREALKDSEDAALRALRYGTLTETPVKNVAQPLRHFLLAPQA